MIVPGVPCESVRVSVISCMTGEHDDDVMDSGGKCTYKRHLPARDL